MNELAWLAGRRFESLVKREFHWVLYLDDDVSINIGCLWRLIEGGRIRRTSHDDGHKFGLPAPVDAAAEVNGWLARGVVTGVDLRAGILDLELHFDNGRALQIVADSSGYEAWSLSHRGISYVAIGGGKLAVFGG